MAIDEKKFIEAENFYEYVKCFIGFISMDCLTWVDWVGDGGRHGVLRYYFLRL